MPQDSSGDPVAASGRRSDAVTLAGRSLMSGVVKAPDLELECWRALLVHRDLDSYDPSPTQAFNKPRFASKKDGLIAVVRRSDGVPGYGRFLIESDSDRAVLPRLTQNLACSDLQ